MDQLKISYKVSRDFGETFNVSIKFLRQNFKLFIQSLIFIAGPFILLSAIAGAFYQADALSYGARRSTNPFANLGWSYVLFILSSALSNLTMIGTVYSYMIVYSEKGPGNFTTGDVAQKLGKNIGNILSVFLLLTFFIVLAVGMIVLLFMGLGNASPVLAVLMGLALIVGMLILFPPLFWQLSVVYLVKMEDNDIVLDSLGRTRQVMKDNFWWTWVIVICSFLAVGIASFVFTLPQIIYQMVLMFSTIRGGAAAEPSIPFMAVATVCTFCSTLLYSVIYIISAFHYYSLAEKKEGTGLMERINEIGKPTDNNADKQY